MPSLGRPGSRCLAGPMDVLPSEVTGSVQHRTVLVSRGLPAASLIPFFFPQDSDMLACHNYWHWALYLIEKVSWPPCGQPHRGDVEEEVLSSVCSPPLCHQANAVFAPELALEPGFQGLFRLELLKGIFHSFFCFVLFLEPRLNPGVLNL